MSLKAPSNSVRNIKQFSNFRLTFVTRVGLSLTEYRYCLQKKGGGAGFKVILVTGCETSRLPHFLDNRLKYGGEVVRLTRRPPFTPQENSWYSFLLEVELTPRS
jgi:hypothetical protein